MSIAFYPTVSCGEIGKYSLIERALLPVSSWAGYALRQQERRGLPGDNVIGSIPVPKLPLCMSHIAADCGGFVATRKWGHYRYTDEQYVEWLEAINPEWAAIMDYCCEDEITSGRPGIVRERQDKTTALAYHFWQTYRDVSWVWVPTLQGWTQADYLHHVREMKPLIDEMAAWYEAQCKREMFRVGIGTLCHRASAGMIRDVVEAVASELGDVHLHLWGVKLSVFRAPVPLPAQVISTDSAAWNGMFASGRNRWKASGYTQREWCFRVALPAYEQRIQAALSTPKQERLFAS